MSNIYIQEPPTTGKVLLTTTVGEIEIELWSRETPKACRNFVQLCLEGFYNNTIIHRVVKGFIAQGGDPSGTGDGGESVYGEPFKNEIHSRLRFTRRGLVATATGGDRNESQFFFTFAAAPVLQNKHTIFGKVVGDTMFNMLKLEDVETDHDDRPIYPPKIIKAEVLSNPFPDISPRNSSINNKVNGCKSLAKEKIAPAKNFKLLSFGDEAEEDEEEILSVNKKLEGKSKSTHDLLQDPSLSCEIGISDVETTLEQNQSTEKMSALERVRSKLKSDQHDKIENSLKSPNKRIKTDEEVNNETQPANIKKSSVRSEYREELRKYGALKKQIPAKGSSRENQTYEMMMAFREKLKKLNQKKENNDSITERDDAGMWMAQAFTCNIPKQNLPKDANKLNDDWYDITDPRNSMNKRRREDSKKVLHDKKKIYK